MLSIEFGERRIPIDEGRLNYVEWVNRVIALHKTPDIEGFRVFFDLTKSYKNLIDEWLIFALNKKVQRLELNFANYASCGRFYSDCYNFDPYNLLKGSFSVSIDHVKYLKKITLHFVYVKDEALEFLLCNCPVLEHLSVSQSDGPTTLKIIGPYPSFKRLEIDLCFKLRSVEIRDVNLVYLKYVNSRAQFVVLNFVVENLPLLVEMYIGGFHLDDVFLLFSNYIPQLEILTLDSLGDSFNRLISRFSSSVKMSNLKQLTVKAAIDYDDPLIWLIELLQASPCLQRFVLEATHSLIIMKKTRNGWPLYIGMKTKMSVGSYHQLKEIQFVGYQGVRSELELLMHFLDNAVALEKILVDTRKPITRFDYLWEIYLATRTNRVDEVEVRARSRAKKELPIKVPPKVNLKIL